MRKMSAAYNFQKMNFFGENSLTFSYSRYKNKLLRSPLATKSPSVFCKKPLTYKIFPVSAKTTQPKVVHPPTHSVS